MIATKALGLAGAQPVYAFADTGLYVFSAKKRLLVPVGAEVPEMMN